MTRREFEIMCGEKPEELLEALHKAYKAHGHNSEQYFEAFRNLWNDRIESLTEYQIKDIMETAKPHTQITNGLETMAWLYDRLLHLKST